jgi:PKHD-type hydroxylase
MTNLESISKRSSSSASYVFYPDTTNLYAYWENAFSPEECQKIIEIGTHKFLEPGLIGPGHSTELGRDSQVSWLFKNDGMEWAYRRMQEIILNLNDQFFQFDLFGMVEGCQFTKYSEPGGKYDSHIDLVFGGPVRKLSFVLQLTPEEEYDGGDLELCLSNGHTPMSRKQGYVTVFPSFVMHQVTPVTKGTRYSLVSWITGKPFK